MLLLGGTATTVSYFNRIRHVGLMLYMTPSRVITKVNTMTTPWWHKLIGLGHMTVAMMLLEVVPPVNTRCHWWCNGLVPIPGADFSRTRWAVEWQTKVTREKSQLYINICTVLFIIKQILILFIAKQNYLVYNFDKISIILHFASFLETFVLIMNKTLCSDGVQHYVWYMYDCTVFG